MFDEKLSVLGNEAAFAAVTARP